MSNSYIFTDLYLNNTKLIESFYTEDLRGTLRKPYSKEVFIDNNILFEPVEELLISSKKAVIRGLHFQRIEGQSKLIRIIEGKIFAVVLDVDRKSETFGKYISLELFDDRKALFVSSNCALGTLALEDTVLSCQCGNKLIAEYSDGIYWNDADLKINWPLDKLECEPILSEKDKKLQSLKEYYLSEK